MASCATDFMKPSSGDKQLGLASPWESAASQSDQTNHPSKNEVRNEVGLDVGHHARIPQRGGENLFYLTSSFTPSGQERDTISTRGRLTTLTSPVTGASAGCI